ncbi:hypothetical protein Btru_075189 [Bulinus truncatus]|nr:hypothetical protein Btru_075189 [Bulinus truncatus]
MKRISLPNLMAAHEFAPASASTSASAQETSRSLVVDEAVFEEQFLRCPVCHEKYNQDDLAPKSLPCNHTFCLPCLIQIYDHSQPGRGLGHLHHDSHDGTLKCPSCRVEIFLNRDKIKDLPNDHRVVQMMDFFTQAVSRSQQVCAKHDGQPVNFFCKKCLVPVCRDCTVLDHKETDGHHIADISAAMQEKSTEFTSVENKSKEVLEKMKRRSDALANASKRLDILEREIKLQIKDAFIEYRLLLEKRQEALTQMATQIIKDQKYKINTTFVSVCESGAQLQKLYDDFKTCRENKDVRKIFSIVQQIKDGESSYGEVANLDDRDLFVSCEFDPQNEGCFLSDLSGLGEVRSKTDPSLRETIGAQQLLLLEMEEQRERARLREIDELEQQAQMHVRNLLSGSSQRHENFRSDSNTDSDDDGGFAFPIPSGLLFNDSQEYMDEGDGSFRYSTGSSHRRIRRARDTNSSQVASSISQAADISAYLDRTRPFQSPPVVRLMPSSVRSGSNSFSRLQELTRTRLSGRHQAANNDCNPT